MSGQTYQIDSSYHYPADLLNLLVETIPLLNKSKEALLDFFEGAGVPEYVLGPYRDQLQENREVFKKPLATRRILNDLNRQDRFIRERREILKRVVEFENYAACWPDDVDKAKLRVHEVRDLVNLKDSVRKIAAAEQQERQARIARSQEEERKRNQQRVQRDELRKELSSLFGMADPHQRGRTLEGLLNRLFSLSGILVRESFVRRDPDGLGVEQIDGVVELDGHLCLVEMKWHAQPLGVEAVSAHLVRVYNRGDVRGLVISASPFTEPAVRQVTEALQQKVFALMELSEVLAALEQDVSMVEVIRTKMQAAQLDKNPFFRVASFG